MSTQPPLASYWLAAAESGFAQKEDWRAWADDAITNLESPPGWILDLSLASSSEDLWRLLVQQLEREEHCGLNPAEIHNAVLGYFWLRHERGEIDLRTCLELAGRFADSYESGVECETFFSLQNQLEAGSNVEVAARELFQAFRELAERQWRVLSSNSV